MLTFRLTPFQFICLFSFLFLFTYYISGFSLSFSLFLCSLVHTHTSARAYSRTSVLSLSLSSSTSDLSVTKQSFPLFFIPHQLLSCVRSTYISCKLNFIFYSDVTIISNQLLVDIFILICDF